MYEARRITKRYGAAPALQDVSLHVREGEVHALLGANGAGKSTLMKILAGALEPTEGELLLDGKSLTFADTRAAAEQGIAWVAQELTVFGELDVLENLFLTREPRRGPLISRREMRARARPFLRMVGLPEELSGPLGVRRLGERQRVEICRALLRKPRILILDEPTSALDAGETRRLLDVVRDLRAGGTGIVLVSHVLEDVFALADTITVLRDGRTVVDAAARVEMTPRGVIEAMLGKRQEATSSPSPRGHRREGAKSHEASDLRLRALAVEGVLEPLSLDIARGEIVALAGLEGSGATVVLDVVYGRIRADGGEVILPGGRSGPRSIAAAVQAGIAFVPADRGRLGLFADQSVTENIAVVRALVQSVDRLMLRTETLREHAGAWVAQLDIRPGRIDLPARALSGGNQQKVVFAKWLEAKPAIYLLDDPTRGVDVGTRAQMHEVVRALADEGAIVLIASSDLDELCSVADRAVVFFHGRAEGELNGTDLDPHRLLEAINTGAVGAPLAIK